MFQNSYHFLAYNSLLKKQQKVFDMDRDQASKFIFELLGLLNSRNGSDLFITANSPPAIKVDGSIVRISPQCLTSGHTMALAKAIMNDRQASDFEKNQECNFAISPMNIGRFRVNVFLQQGHVGMVLRVIPGKPPTINELGLPQILKNIVNQKHGLCILVGATGSGKSTTLAAMLDHRNESTSGHIITVEDPIEFLHSHKQCLITQREIGTDTKSWESALKNAMRQAPDVILMGEIRDRESMELGLAFSETGHMCLATLHASSANTAIERILNFFPETRRTQTLQDLSANIRAIISQRLIVKESTKGRIPAVEIMMNTPLISDLIQKGDISEIKEIMKKSTNIGMQTFDQSLYGLYESGQISYESALKNADSVNDLRLQIKLNGKRNRSGNLAEGTENLTIC